MNYELIKIDQRYILVPTTTHIKLHRMIELNYAASVIFKAVKKGMSMPLMTAFYMDVFGLSVSQAKKDITQTLETFKKQGIISDDL